LYGSRGANGSEPRRIAHEVSRGRAPPPHCTIIGPDIMATVFVRKAAYDLATLKPLVAGLLAGLDPGLIRRGDTVLVKPNFLIPAAPDKAIITHPLIIRAVVECVVDLGGRPVVADSPALGSFDRVLREGGVAEALKGLPVACRPFKESVVVDVGPPFHRIDIAAEAMGADVVINLPKLKTHTQMLLTLGVKNLFGCIVGARKPEWHLRAGIDQERFAELLVRICAAVRPRATLLDGVLGLEGPGPGRGGLPRAIGVVMASADAFSLDAAVCAMLGLRRDDLPTNRVAAREGLLPDDVAIDGELPSVPDLRLPTTSPLVFGPKPLHRFIRKHLLQRPVCDAERCRTCGECWKICPAKAIRREGRGLRFDYDACIRCYCCVEVCPHGALEARETPAGRLVRKLLR
jgi:uncharacterized protein (DUF362 family)/Pyruvate/2-oxoacid:ferredoxin oxidoreductase delta subunit